MTPQELAKLIVGGERFFFLLGAGASVSARIPTDATSEHGLAWQLAISDTGDVAEAENKYGKRALRLVDLFPLIDKPRFRELLRQQNWGSRTPAVCHDVLARLLQEGFAVEVATTNYDPLIENAVTAIAPEVNIVCSVETLDYLHKSGLVISKLHGCPYSDLDANNLLVTEADLQRGRPWIIRMLEARIQERHCVYVGFSGNAEYVLLFVAAVLSELGHVSSYAIDKIPVGDAFSRPPANPLAKFLATLEVSEATYAECTADEFVGELGHEVARLLFDKQLTQSIADVHGPLAPAVGPIAQSIRELLIKSLTYSDAYDFVERLEASMLGFCGLVSASDNLRQFFMWVLVLIAAGVIKKSSLIPALAYPLQRVSKAPPVVIFAGDSHIDCNELLFQIAQRYREDPKFRLRVGCETNSPVKALLIRCRGTPGQQGQGFLMADAPEALIAGDSTPFVWISEHELVMDAANLTETFSA